MTKYRIKKDSEYYGKFVDPTVYRDEGGAFYVKITECHTLLLPDYAVEEVSLPFRIGDEVKEEYEDHLGMVVGCTDDQVDILWDGEDVVQCCLIPAVGIEKTGINRAKVTPLTREDFQELDAAYRALDERVMHEAKYLLNIFKKLKQAQS